MDLIWVGAILDAHQKDLLTVVEKPMGSIYKQDLLMDPDGPLKRVKPGMVNWKGKQRQSSRCSFFALQTFVLEQLEYKNWKENCLA